MAPLSYIARSFSDGAADLEKSRIEIPIFPRSQRPWSSKKMEKYGYELVVQSVAVVDKLSSLGGIMLDKNVGPN